MISSYHTPVLVSQVLDALSVAPGKRYIDGTVGGGGHAKEIVARGGYVLGIDTDEDAIRQNQGNPWRTVQGNFADIGEIAKKEGFEHVDGILLDLGVSSHQLDTQDRGFSYRFGNAPFDMRMRQDGGNTAANLINTATEGELYEILTKFGEEERAGAIAHAFVRARSIKQFQTVADVVSVIDGVGIGVVEKNSVLSRVFQAFRIAVNDELKSIKKGILGAREVLAVNGVLAVITFHSLEDRIVKQMLRDTNFWRVQQSKPIVPMETEITRNRRARSAKLRIAYRK